MTDQVNVNLKVQPALYDRVEVVEENGEVARSFRVFEFNGTEVTIAGSKARAVTKINSIFRVDQNTWQVSENNVKVIVNE